MLLATTSLGVAILAGVFAHGRPDTARTPPRAATEVLPVAINDRLSATGGGLSPLGWILFIAPDAPEPIIHLSRGNALNLMAITLGIREMPLVLQDSLIGRALGRALAHEIGHYLFGSTAHTPQGLMQGVRSASTRSICGRIRLLLRLPQEIRDGRDN